MVKSLHWGRDSCRGIHAKTAHQVWEDLHDQFGQKNASAIFQIHKAITTMFQGMMLVASYYIKLKALWDDLELYRSPIVCNQTNEHQIKKEEDNWCKQMSNGAISKTHTERWKVIKGSSQIQAINGTTDIPHGYSV